MIFELPRINAGLITADNTLFNKKIYHVKELIKNSKIQFKFSSAVNI